MTQQRWGSIVQADGGSAKGRCSPMFMGRGRKVNASWKSFRPRKDAPNLRAKIQYSNPAPEQSSGAEGKAAGRKNRAEIHLYIPRRNPSPEGMVPAKRELRSKKDAYRGFVQAQPSIRIFSASDFFSNKFPAGKVFSAGNFLYFYVLFFSRSA